MVIYFDKKINLKRYLINFIYLKFWFIYLKNTVYEWRIFDFLYDFSVSMLL